MTNTKEYLPLLDGLVNASVLPEDELRLSKQCLLIYRRLLRGSATNDELMIISRSRNISARMSDLRDELQGKGWDLRLTQKHKNGLNNYNLFRADGSMIK